MRRPTISGLATAAVLLALAGAAVAQGQGGQTRGMDHSNMQGMDHSKMQGMDHSKMQGMDHSGMNKPGGQGAAQKPAQDGRSHPPAQQQGSQQRRSN